MEKSLNAYIREQFQLKEVDIRTYSPLALAYIGDGVFDLIIRSVVVDGGNIGVNRMHQRTSHIVKAQTQSKMAEKLQAFFTEEERNIYRRGKNANASTRAKNATLADYYRATGLEAVFGYLYLNDRFDRILFLVQEGIAQIKERI